MQNLTAQRPFAKWARTKKKTTQKYNTNNNDKNKLPCVVRKRRHSGLRACDGKATGNLCIRNERIHEPVDTSKPESVNGV